MLASADVSSSDSLVGQFRYHSITGVLLTAGKNYVVGGLNLGGQWVYSVSNLTVASQITYIQNRYTSPDNANLAMPTATYSPEEYGYFGGSFGFIIPETSSFLLTIIALLSIAISKFLTS